MSMTDPIADFLTRIRNAGTARQRFTDAPSSNVKVAIAGLLKNEGFIEDFSVNAEEGRPVLRVHLKYDEANRNVILGLKRVSRPGRRSYVGKGDLPRVLGGLGVTILSTSRGLMTERDARRQGVGGEVICQVW